MDNSRKLWIDQARGVAMVMVLISHTDGLQIFRPFYMYVMMPLFFFISGYLHKHNDELSFNRLLKRVIYRIFFPYFIFSLAFLLLYYLLGKNRELFYSKFLDIILGRQLWFLPCMIMVEIYIYVFELIRTYFKSNLLYFKLIVIFIAIIAMFIFNEISQCPYYADTAVCALAYYTFGNLYHSNIENSISHSYKKYSFVFICLFFLYMILSGILIRHGYLYNMSINNYSLPVVSFIINILGIISIFITVQNYNIGKIWGIIGQNTMLIYCINRQTIDIGSIINNHLFFIFNYYPNIIVSGLMNVLWALLLSLIISYPINRYCPILVGNKKNAPNKLHRF